MIVIALRYNNNILLYVYGTKYWPNGSREFGGTPPLDDNEA